MYKTKRFRLSLYESEGFIIIQRRVFFIWITLYDDGEVIKFKNVFMAEEYLNKLKKFGEIFIIDYRKISH